MKQTKTFLAAAMLFGGTLVMACTLISTPQADSAALAAVGGGRWCRLSSINSRATSFTT